MFQNPLLRALAAGEASIGSWVSTPEPVWAELIASCGFDHVIIDLQHGSTELATLVPVLQAIRSGGSVPVVRVAANDPAAIGKALDLGALGIIVPLVESAAEAARAVAACRFPPVGARSAGPVRSGPVMASEDIHDWERVACIVMVETAAGLEAAEAIAATPGLDAIYVGPGDLAISLGLSPYRSGRSAEEEARHRAALLRVRDACATAGIASGLYVGDGAAARDHLADGFRLVTASIDVTLIEAGSRRDLALARGEVGA